MTRINLVHPSELMDQHLFAEFREIKMVPKALARSLIARLRRKESVYTFLYSIPKEFTLNAGHVMFFYDKGEYLRLRYELLKNELRLRDIKFDEDSLFDPDGVYRSLDDRFNKNYIPNDKAYAIIRQRIAEKIAMKPDWYRHSGKNQEL